MRPFAPNDHLFLPMTLKCHVADLPLAIALTSAYGRRSPYSARHLPVTEGNETLPPNKGSAHVSFQHHRMDCVARHRADVSRTADPGGGSPAWIDARMSRALKTGYQLEDMKAS